MAVIIPNEDITKLVKSFGFDPRKVRKFQFTTEVDSIVTVEVEMYPTQEEITNGANAAEVLMKKYELVEKKDERKISEGV